jgi:hypothetical protein
MQGQCTTSCSSSSSGGGGGSGSSSRGDGKNTDSNRRLCFTSLGQLQQAIQHTKHQMEAKYVQEVQQVP